MRYITEEVASIVANSISWAEVCRRLGRKQAGGTQTHLKNFCIKNNINYSHFLGQAHGKNLGVSRVNINEYLENGKFIKSHDLKLRLIRIGLKQAKCEVCNLSEWNGEPIVLELDHIDNNHENNTLSNLKILCPNCHALKTRKERLKRKKAL